MTWISLFAILIVWCTARDITCTVLLVRPSRGLAVDVWYVLLVNYVNNVGVKF